ncbi:alpha-amylase family glycosyl hydrolase [Clostridium sp. ZS2-4]|uniref:alpha-amylase family glycosyl hydrolase n=1 Tax=Clostridium sp. ZS2-4 TaxID=2987703 RepID=UPI00227B35BD|nr:alpha-amylase family glycosyl hydrolase [Clostridium sp. ZS2-4]MCY6354240.1 alpha-amylase family glycosyl hydrolase [Clostridium sp. ZS2-4]
MNNQKKVSRVLSSAAIAVIVSSVSIIPTYGFENKSNNLKQFTSLEVQSKDSLKASVQTIAANTDFKKFEERKVVLAGSLQNLVGETNWNPASEKTRFKYDGNGMYSLTLKDIPAGSYQYKVAMGSWDPENYGADGIKGGENIKLDVDKKQDITFWYSDATHMVRDSLSYKKLDIYLAGISETSIKLKDEGLVNIYSASVNLKKGDYKNIKVKFKGKSYTVNAFKLNTDKLIKFSFHPETETVFCNASEKDIQTQDIYYNSRMEEYKKPYGAVKEGTEVTFNLQTRKDDVTTAKFVVIGPEGKEVINMTKNGKFDYDKNNKFDKWTVKYTPKKIGINKYYFMLSNGSQVKIYGDDDGYLGSGKAGDLGTTKDYTFNVYKKDFKTPDWMKNGIVYQIFPDRFFNGDKRNDEAQKYSRGPLKYEFYKDWYSIPENPKLEENPDYSGTKGDGEYSDEMYGGDLKGIEKKLDYLKTLGVNVLYLNPIAHSVSNHRYDTTDYRTIDPLLGDMKDFESLVKEAKKRNIKIVLDGVFNHVSDDSIYFDRYGKFVKKGKPLGAYQYWAKVYNLMNEKGYTQKKAEEETVKYFENKGITDLHYKDWFVVENEKIDKGKSTEHYKYEGWWGYDSMPVIKSIDGSEYNLKSWSDEIIDGKDANSRYWLKKGTSGWRLDVANEVSKETWRNFRKAAKEEGDNVLIGEIWNDASEYLLGDMYDSVMNYRFRDAVLGFVNGKDITSDEVVNILETVREQYPKEAFEVMLNLVGSHDTQRAISALDGYKKSEAAIAKAPSKEAFEKMKLIPLIQMTYPGAPCTYYGDEAGAPGADDPDNRRGMIWGKGNKELVEWYAKLGNIRHAYKVLRTGSIDFINTEDSDVLSYIRKDSSNISVVCVNRANIDKTLNIKVDKDIKNGTKLTDILTGKEYIVSNDKINVKVPKYNGLILVKNVKSVKVNYNALKDAYEKNYIVK